MTFEPQESEGMRFVDKRRIDPETGEVRVPQPAAAPSRTAAEPSPVEAPGPEAAGPSEVEVALAERTADLQRLQAEYVNYKRRVDRDREGVRESASASVLTALLPVLDDIGRAREHGELTGGFKAVAESLERTLSGLGLVRFGEVGDGFDPRVHEALMHTYSDDVPGPVCQAIVQVGYRLHDRVVRPARVAVAEPETQPVAAATSYDMQGSEVAGDGDGDPRGNEGEAGPQGDDGEGSQ